MWDPHTCRNIVWLEQINTKTARFITNNYTNAWNHNALKTTNKHGAPSHLQTSTQAYSYVQNHKHSHWHWLTYISTQHKQSMYHTNTDTYKYSYLPRTICNCNRLPQHISDSKTLDSFTKQIHTHLSPQQPYTNNYTWFTLLPAHSVLPTPTNSQLHIYAWYEPELVPYVLLIRIRKSPGGIIATLSSGLGEDRFHVTWHYSI